MLPRGILHFGRSQISKAVTCTCSRSPRAGALNAGSNHLGSDADVALRGIAAHLVRPGRTSGSIGGGQGESKLPQEADFGQCFTAANMEKLLHGGVALGAVYPVLPRALYPWQHRPSMEGQCQRYPTMSPSRAVVAVETVYHRPLSTDELQPFHINRAPRGVSQRLL